MIGRDRELDWLSSALDGDRQVLVVYGRRRIGKTTLVTEALADRPAVYYLCDERGTAHNARAFAARCAEALDDVTPAVEGFAEAFEYLTRRTDGPFVVECEVAADRDPGYGATAQLFGESAMCLVSGEIDSPVDGGVLTPASGIGDPLADRLRDVGLTIDAREWPGDEDRPPAFYRGL